jgi:uncharacterized paraquat-inducible protein A
VTFALAVASSDAVAAERVVRDLWAAELDPGALAAAERTVDMDSAEARCPACDATFDPSEARCPGCGLRFGG